MSTARRPSRARVLRALLPVLLAGPLSACGDDSPVVDVDPEAKVVAAIEQTLRQRAQALVRRDEAGFDRTVVERAPRLAAEQERYFDNLGQLPIGLLRYELDPDSLELDGNGYWAEITIHLQLEGYDVAPVATHDRWRFAPTRNERRYLLASTTDAAWEEESGPQPQPWDLGEIEVREGPGVLGIFDATTLPRADAVVSAVSEGRFEVRSVLPDDVGDPGGVVVYALADPSFVESLDSLPVKDPARLDGATVPVPRNDRDDSGKVSSYRVVLSPHVLYQDQSALDRLVRHELTHVALGEHARGAPLWLTEGLAEYVSVRPIAPAERQLQSEALDLIATDIRELPPDAAFGEARAEGWYAVSWWVCEYVAATYGETVLWSLLEQLADGGDQHAVVEDLLDISTADLVDGGVDLMRRTYG